METKLQRLIDWLDLERRFPTEEERYRKYLLFLVVIKLTSFMMLGTNILGQGWGNLWFKVGLVLHISFFILTICLYMMNGVWSFLIRTLPCVVSSALVIVAGCIVVGPVALILALVLTVLYNRKRFNQYCKHKSLCLYVVITYIITSDTAETLYENMFVRSFGEGRMLRLAMLLISCVPLVLLWIVLKREAAKGKSFLETVRATTLIVPSFLVCVLGCMTLCPLKFLSDNYIFGETDHDFLAMD